MYVYGGIGTEASYPTEIPTVWVYDTRYGAICNSFLTSFSSDTWLEPFILPWNYSNNIPPTRMDHSAVMTKSGEMIVFGGTTSVYADEYWFTSLCI
jgi:hypothetical protein